VNLGALTRVEWSAIVEVPDDMPEAEIKELADRFYDEIDGGEYWPDSDFWDKGTCCVDLDVSDDRSPTKYAIQDDEIVLVERGHVDFLEEFRIECFKRGWGLFRTDDSTLRLQAIDNPEAVSDEYDIMVERFEGTNRDRLAAMACKESAAKGDPVARQAIAMLLAAKSPDIRELGLVD